MRKTLHKHISRTTERRRHRRNHRYIFTSQTYRYRSCVSTAPLHRGSEVSTAKTPKIEISGMDAGFSSLFPGRIFNEAEE
jgi:hypothetical protein